MKTAIIYYSKHHENTKKLLDALQGAFPGEITLFDVTQAPSAGLEEYDLIGFASGIYYSKFEKRVLAFAKDHTPEGKNVFFLYTCGSEKKGYTKAIRDALAGRKATILGEYGCLGFDTYGPLKLIGGLAKNHPNRSEIEQAVAFYGNLRK